METIETSDNSKNKAKNIILDMFKSWEITEKQRNWFFEFIELCILKVKDWIVSILINSSKADTSWNKTDTYLDLEKK